MDRPGSQAGEDAAIVRALVMLGHSLRMQVVAAGVETAEQLTHLRAVACDWAHGPQVSRPLTAAQADALLGQTSPMQLLSPSGPGGAARQTRAGQIRMEGAPRRP